VVLNRYVAECYVDSTPTSVPPFYSDDTLLKEIGEITDVISNFNTISDQEKNKLFPKVYYEVVSYVSPELIEYAEVVEQVLVGAGSSPAPTTPTCQCN
jgi:hypothetical protein